MSEQWLDRDGAAGLVSVVVPVFNRARLVTQALDSVRAQTYRPVELVIVDDGSTDKTPEVLAQWVEQNAEREGLKIVHLRQENCGAPSARNTGCARSQGQYIQFLDSDDLLLPHKLSSSVHVLRLRDVRYTYCCTRVTDIDGNPLSLIGRPLNSTAASVPDYSWHTSGPLYYRSLLRDVGPWTAGLKGSQDWEYCARVKLHSFNGHYDPTPGSVYRIFDIRRISKKGFDYAYTRSTEAAYDNVWHLAAARGQCTNGFSDRMARLYLYRALEYLSATYKTDAYRCLDKALQSPASITISRLAAHVCRILPSPTLARSMLRAIAARNRLQQSSMR